MSAATYPFSDGNRLEDRNAYFYTPFGGEAFLEAWRRQRRDVLAGLPAAAAAAAENQGSLPEADPGDTRALLEYVHGALLDGKAESPDIREWLAKLVRKFEVTKRIHAGYDERFLAIDKNAYRDPALYVRLAEVLDKAYEIDHGLVYLNALLKCLDTLCSLKDGLDDRDQARLARLIGREATHVNRLAEGLAVR